MTNMEARKAEKRNRDIRIAFRVSAAEYDKIAARMNEVGMRNREAYLRKMALMGYIIHLDLTEVRELVYLLGNAANNMNQIARRVNSSNSIYKEDIADLQANYRRLMDTANGLFAKLSDM